jgi:hypothetical protein
MAKLIDLVSCSAEITGVPEATVREISRRLREAGLISTGKVGRYGGADMTASDAASLLTGLLVAGSSAVAINDLGSFTKSHLNLKSYLPRQRPPLLSGTWSRVLALPLLHRLKNGHAFRDALTALIESAANGDYERAIKKWAESGLLNPFGLKVSLGRPRPEPEAKIEFSSPNLGEYCLLYLRPADVRLHQIFTPAAPRKWSHLLSDPRYFDLEVNAVITESTIAALGRVLQGEAH